ncbi:hypothetical protein [Kineosporia babensis]|uniref:Uncharacterized protein n=1 Tax=Kineosporia babensis TaxID=499548 RepID=A0A9X1SWA7_9ACTN|nr:hypothetical protein [Kineosporia babensis]MCD5314862.1 hypothetical protein [Kineosporia babensis]
MNLRRRRSRREVRVQVFEHVGQDEDILRFGSGNIMRAVTTNVSRRAGLGTELAQEALDSLDALDDLRAWHVGRGR